MSKKLNLILCAQGHLPSGTGEAEFEALYNKEIKPLVSALDKFPRINAVFHYSGVILHWIERRHPELFMLLEDLLSRKQAEFLGGGFYDPMLPLLPLTDKIGQIEMMSAYLRKHFGKRPQGCWLPAMAWEQNLVGPLTSCGMNYTFLEDQQFSGAGARPCEGGIFHPCNTEDQGKLITVFPVAGAIGRDLRRGNANKILGEILEKCPENENSRIIVFTAGKEAPSEPGKGYEVFFEELSNADPLVEFTTPFKIHKNLRGLHKVYFPSVWPRQFLADHPEAGGIYAKMIYVHSLINNQLRGDKTRKRTAREELWKAQDSGIFRLGSVSSPGLLHSPVRKAAYSALLEGEKITREKGKFTPSLSVFDFDLDGEGEYVFQDEKLNCCVKSRGACVLELDYLPAAWNYLDTLSKNGERRCAFADWLAPARTLPEDLGPDGIKGGRFCGLEEYEVSETDRVRRRIKFKLPPKTALPWGEIEIEKTWQLKKNSLALEYVLKNCGQKSERFIFSPTVDLSFPGEGEDFLRIHAYREGEKESFAYNGAVDFQKVRVLEFQDVKNEAVITLESSRNLEGRIFHIRSGIPGREEYQSTCLMPLLTVSLEGGKTWKAAFSLKVTS